MTLHVFIWIRRLRLKTVFSSSIKGFCLCRTGVNFKPLKRGVEQNTSAYAKHVCKISSTYEGFIYVFCHKYYIIIIINRFYLTHPFYVVLCSNISGINNINTTQYMEVKIIQLVYLTMVIRWQCWHALLIISIVWPHINFYNYIIRVVWPPLVEMLFIVSAHWKQKWIITTFKLIIFYCLTTFCNIKLFIYLPLGIFSSELYSSFLLVKPRAVRYKLSISSR